MFVDASTEPRRPPLGGPCLWRRLHPPTCRDYTQVKLYLVRDVKSDSSEFINRKGWIRGRFNWQEGFGAFSYSHSHLDSVIGYIRNQEEHHAKKSFRKEYLTLLKRFDIAYDPKYVFEFADGE